MKKLLLIFGIIAMFMLAGCTTDGETNAGAGTTFIGGTQGLIGEFESLGVEEDGKEVTWEDTEFPIVLRFYNKGEDKIEENELTVNLKGIDTTLFDIDQSQLKNTEAIDKVSELNEMGGETTIDFGEGELTDVTGSFYDANIFASYEYLYQTNIAVPKVCFKEDFSDEDLCEVDQEKQASSSGAPIVAKRVVQKPAGSGKISLTFEIENVGGGDVTTPDDDFSSLYDKLAFEITEGNDGTTTFDCRSAGQEGVGRFNNNKLTIQCKSNELPVDTLYTKQVTLTLNYKYKDIVQKTIRIKGNPEE